MARLGRPWRRIRGNTFTLVRDTSSGSRPCCKEGSKQRGRGWSVVWENKGRIIDRRHHQKADYTNLLPHRKLPRSLHPHPPFPPLLPNGTRHPSRPHPPMPPLIQLPPPRANGLGNKVQTRPLLDTHSVLVRLLPLRRAYGGTARRGWKIGRLSRRSVRVHLAVYCSCANDPRIDLRRITLYSRIYSNHSTRSLRPLRRRNRQTGSCRISP